MGMDRTPGAPRLGAPAALAGLVAAVAAAIAAAGVLGAVLPATTSPGGELPSVVDDAGIGG